MARPRASPPVGLPATPVKEKTPLARGQDRGQRSQAGSRYGAGRSKGVRRNSSPRPAPLRRDLALSDAGASCGARRLSCGEVGA